LYKLQEFLVVATMPCIWKKNSSIFT